MQGNTGIAAKRRTQIGMLAFYVGSPHIFPYEINVRESSLPVVPHPKSESCRRTEWVLNS